MSDTKPIEIEVISDDAALEALKTRRAGRAQFADIFCTHTVVHPVKIMRKAGVEEVEIRNYVTMGQFYPERKMEKAKDVEKRYSRLNKAYVAELKARKLPTFRKDPGAKLLDASPIE
jgi:hypothetical protein